MLNVESIINRVRDLERRIRNFETWEPPESEDGGGDGDMTKAVYDTDDDGVVDNSERLEGDTEADVRNHAPQAHSSSHKDGGSDELDAAELAGALGSSGQFLKTDGDAASWDTPTANDDDAIHDNVAGEIAAVTEKANPVDADLVLIEDSEDSNNKKRVQAGNLPGGDGGAQLTESRIGLMFDPLTGNSLSTKEAIWTRVGAMADVTLTKVQAAIAAADVDIRCRIVEVDDVTGSTTIAAIVHETSYQSVSPSEFAEFSGLSVSLEKDKIYASIIEVESGSSLSMYENQAQLGYGSLLPATSNLGGYCSRNAGVGDALNEYNSSLPTQWLSYE